MAAIALLLGTSSGLVPTPLSCSAPILAPGRSSRLQSSLFSDEKPDEARRVRLLRVAELHDLDPVLDAVEIANRAASSLPEEENGTWADVAMCSLRNACGVAAILAAVGALPGQASAATPNELSIIFPSSAVLLADAETIDVIASIAVPLLVGGALVAFLAANYENFIDKLNDGR